MKVFAYIWYGIWLLAVLFALIRGFAFVFMVMAETSPGIGILVFLVRMFFCFAGNSNRNSRNKKLNSDASFFMSGSFPGIRAKVSAYCIEQIPCQSGSGRETFSFFIPMFRK